jgi:O-antigen/teichoic acid export membrane protein
MILVYIRKHYDFINLKTKFDKNTLEQKWDVMYHKIAGMILDNSPLVLLTILCSLSEVSIYSIYAMIFLAVSQFIDTLSDGMQGFFGRFLAEDNPDRLKRIFGKYETMCLGVIGIGYTCALLFTIPFMRIYTKNMTDANYIQPMLVVLFVCAGVMIKIRQPATMLIVSAGHFKQTKWRAVAEAVINVSAGVFFVIKLGFTGVLLGAVCGFAYRTLDIIVYSSRHIVHNSLLATFGKIIIFGIWYYAGYFVLSNFVISDIENYLDFVKNAVISLVFLAIPAGIYWTCYNSE